jgi:ferrous iron transport protein A
MDARTGTLMKTIEDAGLTDQRGELVSLADRPIGFSGVIAHVATPAGAVGGVAGHELERRLLEMGFVEGATVKVLHEGLFGGDPICVRLDDMRVALRRGHARGILVRPAGQS